MATDPLEKKLDRYYEDIMNKLMEISDTQKATLGEQKSVLNGALFKLEIIMIFDTNQKPFWTEEIPP